MTYLFLLYGDESADEMPARPKLNSAWEISGKAKVGSTKCSKRVSAPSGANTEYVLELAQALRRMNAEDDHVFELAAAVEGALRGRQA